MKMKIAIVDDDDILREEIQEWLEGEGHVVSAFASGSEALVGIKEDDFHVILTDLKMPEMDGLELICRVVAINPSLPIIMITGYGSIDSAIDAMKQGASDYIQKPFRPEELLKSLDSVMENCRVGEQVVSMFEKVKIGKDDCRKRFNDFLKSQPGLWITKDRPDSILTEASSGWKARLEYIWLFESDKSPLGAGDGNFPERNADVFPLDVQELSKLESLICGFLSENEDGAILFEGLELLMEKHPYEPVKKLLTGILEAQRPLNRIIISFDKEGLDDKNLQDLRRHMGKMHLQEISEALGSPIRRDIVRYLSIDESASFSEILRHLSTKESPKVSFHLKKLIEDTLLSKDQTKQYTLTANGRLAAKYLKAIEKESTGDLNGNVALIMC